MKHLLTTCLIALLCTVGLHAQSFKVTLNVTNAQVANLIVGCQKDATDGMDKLDIPVPPFGMGSGTVSLRHADKAIPPLYQDLRSATLPQTWTVMCEPRKPKAIVISWDRTQLPKDLDLFITVPRRPRIAMHSQAQVTLRAKSKLLIQALPKAPQK